MIAVVPGLWNRLDLDKLRFECHSDKETALAYGCLVTTECGGRSPRLARQTRWIAIDPFPHTD